MSDKNNSITFFQDNEFRMACGWLAAAAVSIASWAFLNGVLDKDRSCCRSLFSLHETLWN